MLEGVSMWQVIIHCNVQCEADVHANDVINAIETRLSSQRAICTVRCSPSCSIEKVEVVKRFMRGVFKNRPTLPRRIVVYDSDIIHKQIWVITLTKKLCTLLCMLSRQRARAIPALPLDVFDSISRAKLTVLTSTSIVV